VVTAGALATLVAAAVTGCSSTSFGGDDRPVTSAPPRVSPLGPFFGECGGVRDEELADAVGMPPFTTGYRNSVGCVWENGAALGGPIESFSWYRGSPIGREMAGSGLIGRPPEKITVAGHPGFKGQQHQSGGDICEISVQFGDDFFEWSVSFGSIPPPVDSCAAALKLANLTIARTK
jgi:hypothetical protein